MTEANAVGKVSGNNAYAYNPNMYYDVDDADIDLIGTSTNPMAAGSIFGAGYAGGFCPTPIAGMGYNQQDYFKNMKQYQQFNIDYMVDQSNMSRNADLRINASMEAIKGRASILKDKIVNNEQDQIMDCYNNYVNAVASAYGKGTPQEIKARAYTLYTQMNGGKTLIQDLRDYSHGSATQGFIQALTFGAYDRHSAEDNISEITGAPVGTTEKGANNAGRIAGAATIGGVTGAVAKALKFKHAGKLGLIAGAISLGMSIITGKVTT